MRKSWKMVWLFQSVFQPSMPHFTARRYPLPILFYHLLMGDSNEMDAGKSRVRKTATSRRLRKRTVYWNHLRQWATILFLQQVKLYPQHLPIPWKVGRCRGPTTYELWHLGKPKISLPAHSHHHLYRRHQHSHNLQEQRTPSLVFSVTWCNSHACHLMELLESSAF